MLSAQSRVRPLSSSPVRTDSAASMLAKKKRLRRQFIFDHLWGIPGGWSKYDLALLR